MHPKIFKLILTLIILGISLIEARSAPTASVNVVAEFGSSTVTNNNYLTVNLSNTYTNLIVVASPRYSTNDTARSTRVFDKTTNSFQIKVDNHNGSITGNTTVDWIAFEAGTYNLDIGGSLTNIIAGSENVSNVSCNGNFGAGGTTVNFGGSFSSAPSVIHTVSSDLDNTWVFSSAFGPGNRANDISNSSMVLTLQRSFESCTHGAEDIDYLAFEVVHGVNNSNDLEAGLSTDTVGCCTGTGYNVNFNTAFSSSPQTIVVAQNGEDGGNGSYALVHTGASPNTVGFSASVDEAGTGADRNHTTEPINYIAFEPASGELAEITSSIWDQDTFLELWLKANDLVLNDNDPVSTWTDSGVNNNDLIQAGGLRPLFKNNINDNINFNPVLDFDGLDDFLEDADGENYLNGEDGASVFVIIESDSATSDVGFFSTDNTANSDNGLAIRYDAAGFLAPGTNLIKFADGSNPVINGETPSNTQSTNPQMIDLLRETGSVPELYIDGALSATTTVLNNSATMANLDYLRVGDHPKGVWDGKIAEVLVYREKLNPTDRRKIESYLAIKYGMTLEQTGTGSNYLGSVGNIVFDADTAGAGSGEFNNFNNDIFGIAQDDNSSLNQTSSKSINSDAIITMSNASDLGTGEYLIIGNDNDDDGIIEEINTELPVNLVFNRLDREWKADITGNPGTVTLTFDLNGISTSATQSSDFVLLIDSIDSDFSNGITKTVNASSFTSNILSFNNVDLNSGDVFTIGINRIGPGGIGENLTLWVKANEVSGLSDNDNLNLLNDFSGKEHNASQASGAAQPNFRDNSTDSINFNPVIEFNGTSDRLAVEDLSYTGTNAISQIFSCSVFRTSFVSASGFVNWAFLDYDRSEYFNYYIEGDGSIDFSYAAGGINDNTSTTTGYNDGQPHIACVNYDGSMLIDTTIRADGSSVFSSNEEPLNQTIGTSNTRFGYIGDGSEATTFNGTGNNIFYDGDIAEVLYFQDKSFTPTDIFKVESYLAIKYGITLDQSGAGQEYIDSSGSTVFDSDTGGAFNSYNNDIAGIAQDDSSSLDQNSSRSINPDSVITVTNPSSLDNGDFLLWGNDNDDNGIIETTTVGKPTEFDLILDRTWRVSETGETGTLEISFDLTGLSLPGGTEAADIKLLIDSIDSDFSNGAVFTNAQSFNSNIVTFTNVNLANLDHITLGIIDDSGNFLFGMPY